MIYQIFALRDKKLGAYTAPMYDNHTKEVFVELFTRQVAATEDEKQLKALSDQDLYYLGQYDDKSGFIQAVKPELMVCLDEYCYRGEKGEVQENA